MFDEFGEDVTDFGSSVVWIDATLDASSGAWRIGSVNFEEPGVYRINVVGVDAAGNVSSLLDNPRVDFVVLE